MINKLSKFNKNTRLLIYSASGLVVLGAVAALLLLIPGEIDLKEDDSEENETATTEVVFTDKSTDDVDTVKISNASGSFTIKRSGSEFKIEEFDTIKAPLDASKLSNMITNLSALTFKQLVEENAQDLEKYGLAEPVASAEITFNDGTKANFGIGIDAPTGSFMYVCETGSNDVYMAAAYKVNGLLNTSYDYIITSLMEEYNFDTAPSILKITVQKPGEEDSVIEIIPANKENGAIRGVSTHRFTQPVVADVDITLGERLIYGMYGLTAIKSVRAGGNISEYEPASLEEPVSVIEMQVGGKSYTLTVGQPLYLETEDEDGNIIKTLEGYHGTFSEYPDVIYLFDKSSIPWLNIDYEEAMAKMFLLPYIYSITDVILETQEETLHFSLEKDTSENAAETDYFYYLNGEKINVTAESRFKTLYQYMISIKAEAIYNEEATLPLIARYTYKYADNETPDDVVEIYESDDRRIIIYFNGIPMYKCRALYATRLLQNVEAFINGDEINTSW